MNTLPAAILPPNDPKLSRPQYYEPLQIPARPGGPLRLPEALESFQPGPGFPHSPKPFSLHSVPIISVDLIRYTCRFLLVRSVFPLHSGGSASMILLSRPAQASRSLWLERSLNHPRRPMSKSFDPARNQTKPPVGYQTHRLLSGLALHPPVICPVGAHRIKRLSMPLASSFRVNKTSLYCLSPTC